MSASACTFSSFFAFIGWYDVTGVQGWKGFAIYVLAAFAAQGLAVPGWTWNSGVRLAVAGLVAVSFLSFAMVVAFFLPPLFLVIPGLPIGFGCGWARRHVVLGSWGGVLGFNALILVGLNAIFHDAVDTAFFPAPGVISLAIYGALGGTVLGWFLADRESEGGTQSPEG
jgi:hypothetical protein